MAKKTKSGVLMPVRPQEPAPFADFYREFTRGWVNMLPEISMVDQGSTIKIKADVPNIPRDRIKINVSKHGIEIKAAAKSEKERKGKGYFSKQSAALGYYRSLPLPSEVDPKTAKARFVNGTLEITLVKKAGETRKVPVD